MRFLIAFMAFFVFYSCEEAQHDSNVEAPVSEKETTKKDLLTEVITRTYSVKIVDNEPTIDTLLQVQSITNDSKGKEIENTFYNLDMSISWIDRYTYNEQGNKIGSEYFDKGTENTIYYTYDLDEEGRKTFFQAYDKATDALLFNGATFYGESGRLKKDGYINQKGEFICNFEYQLDDDGLELGYRYIDALSGPTSPSIYKYVEHNADNEWTKRLVVSDGEAQSIETREFVKKEN